MSNSHTPNDTASNEQNSDADILNPFDPPAADDASSAESGQGTSSAEAEQAAPSEPSSEDADAQEAEPDEAEPAADPVSMLFQAPDLSAVKPVRRPRVEESDADEASEDTRETKTQAQDAPDQRGRRGHQPQDEDRPEERPAEESASEDSESSSGQGRSRRKRRRGGRGRSRQPDTGDQHSGTTGQDASADAPSHGDGGSDQDPDRTQEGASEEAGDGEVVRRRRRRRRGSYDMEVAGGDGDDPEHTVTRVRAPRETSEASAPTKVTGLKGSTRLEAKRQRRRSSRDSGRRRQVITEAEFLARRESVDRKMIVRQVGERIQIAVLEDGVLAEHSVSNTQQDSLIGNVYLGKVQNVLPSMEAAFVDIGRGRNAVLYAGEVDWNAANLNGAPRKIENALKSGTPVPVQVTKDPVGHKGARLTSQVSLPGRYLVFVPGGSMTGISRKLPDTERARLKKILKEHMPENAGVIVRTAAEGASEEELTNDINRLRALWETIQAQTKDRKVLAPELLYSEPDLTIKVVRDVFNEDFSSMEIQGEETWDSVEAYVTYVAPHLLDRLHRWEPEEQDADDIFAHHRIDEQLAKALDRKVNLPSGGSLVFDRTEAMTVVDVNTGKFTGSGGNLEETVTRNNLEAAEEFVRQLRLRDIGGIIVVDFIDMVLESNRDLVLRRLVECLGRDRTKHQVAEVTSLGLVQMTRKRMGTGLLEVFSEPCEHCAGRGLMTHDEPVGQAHAHDSQGEPRSGKSSKKRRKGKGGKSTSGGDAAAKQEVSAEDREKQEKARQALAQVAAATAEQSSDSSADPGDDKSGADSSEARRSRRGRRPRRAEGRGQRVPEGSDSASSGADTDEASGDAAAVLTIGGESVPVPRGDHHSQGSGHRESATETLDSLDEALSTRSREGAASGSGAPAGSRGGRRRRRAAGSAQGAGGQVQEVSATVSAPAKSFSSAEASPAASGSAEAQGSASEPVMFGVGVSAEDISQAAGGSTGDATEDSSEPST